uniref:Uncharacterized protein n=1 Tax=Amphilophus citrinellus TaxID=61819 RepID=A0A3Q0R7I9_AMPCI
MVTIFVLFESINISLLQNRPSQEGLRSLSDITQECFHILYKTENEITGGSLGNDLTLSLPLESVTRFEVSLNTEVYRKPTHTDQLWMWLPGTGTPSSLV